MADYPAPGSENWTEPLKAYIDERAAQGRVVLLEEGQEPPVPPVPGAVYLRMLSSGGGGPTADTVPPSVPTGLVSSSISATGFRITWAASTDNAGVQSYQVRTNGGTPVNVTSGLTLAFTGLTASTAYSTQIRAKDFAGNFSAWSTALPVSTLAAGATGGASIFGTAPPFATVSGSTDGPATLAMGFYTTLAEGMDVIGARVYLPEGLASSFYNNGIAVTSILRSHTTQTPIPAATFNSGIAQNGFASPLVPGWNEVLFAEPIHVSQYAAGTDNAIWITIRYNSVPNYLHMPHTGFLTPIQSTAKPGVYLAETAFPRSGNNLGDGTSSLSYPIDILVA